MDILNNDCQNGLSEVNSSIILLNNDLHTEVNGDFTALDWRQGTIITGSGSTITTDTTRICLNQNVITSSMTSVTAKTGYKFLVYAWTDTTYLGVWNGTEFIKTSATGLAVISQDLTPLRRAGATDIYILSECTLQQRRI